MKRGEIYYHGKFKFILGHPSPKILICLSENNSDEALVCYTTSKQGKKSDNPGCDKHKSVYFIKRGGEFFDVDTWLELGMVRLMKKSDLENDENVIKRPEILSPGLMSNIISCLKSSRDLDPGHEDYLK